MIKYVTVLLIKIDSADKGKPVNDRGNYLEISEAQIRLTFGSYYFPTVIKILKMLKSMFLHKNMFSYLQP